MAIKSLDKANALVRDLKDLLEKRVKGTPSGRVDTVREAKDSEGQPVLFLSDNGNEAAGQPVILIQLKQIDMVSKDIFGNDLKAYAPHVLTLSYELATGGIVPNVLDITKVMFELAKLGVKIQVKEIASGTAVTIANANAAAVAEEYDWLYWPTKGV